MQAHRMPMRDTLVHQCGGDRCKASALALIVLVLHLFISEAAAYWRVNNSPREAILANTTKPIVNSSQRYSGHLPPQAHGSLSAAAQSGQLRRKHTACCLDPQHDDGPVYELVISRYDEDLEWIAEVPCLWSITVYDKGGWEHSWEYPFPSFKRHVKVVPVVNDGREGETIARHIITRYDSMADYTAFTQGNPFLHNRFFLQLLKHPALLGAVQTMSVVYLENGGPAHTTPVEVVSAYRKHLWYRSERISLRTLDSVYFHDEGTLGIMHRYLYLHQVPIGTNIVANHLNLMGLHDWVPHNQEVGSFAYGGMLGVHKSKILQHPKYVYENIRAAVIAHEVNGYVQERCWVMIFGGSEFTDV